jgi:hypothetical protein
MPFSGRRNVVSIVGFMLGVTLVLSVIIPWAYDIVMVPDWVYVLVGVLLFIAIGQRYGRFKEEGS